MSINTDRFLVSRPFAADVSAVQGGTDAWYDMACANMAAMLKGKGIRTEEVPFPEQFKGGAYARSHGLNEGAYVHLMFRTADAIRTIPGHHNIGCFGWGFEVLKENGRPQDSVLDNQVRMLSLCDEVWAPSTFSRTVLAEHGVQAHVLPAPIATPESLAGKAEAARRLAFIESVGLMSFSAASEQEYTSLVEKRRRSLGRQEALADGAGPVFLTVCDPSDPSKNFANLVEGFLLATQKRSKAVLIVRLQGTGVPGAEEARRAGLLDQSGSLTLAESLFRQVRPVFGHPHCVSENRVLLVSEASLGEDAEALYELADFYLSASFAEAQNIPMLEAMAHGCVPVSVRNTGPADYLSAENAVIIPHGRYTGIVPGLLADRANKIYAIDHADRYQVAQAVGAALALSPVERSAKQDRAREAVRAGYAPEVIFERVLRRLRLMDPALTAERLATDDPTAFDAVPRGSAERHRPAAR